MLLIKFWMCVCVCVSSLSRWRRGLRVSVSGNLVSTDGNTWNGSKVRSRPTSAFGNSSPVPIQSHAVSRKWMTSNGIPLETVYLCAEYHSNRRNEKLPPRALRVNSISPSIFQFWKKYIFRQYYFAQLCDICLTLQYNDLRVTCFFALLSRSVFKTDQHVLSQLIAETAKGGS